MTNTEGDVRKIQFTGKSSYSLNLPKAWVKTVGLKAQESVIVSEEGNSLIVTPLMSGEGKGRQIDLVVDSSDVEKGIRRVISAYLAGCELIRLVPKDGRLGLEYKDRLKEAVSRRTIGFEVIEDSMKELTFQALATNPIVDIFAMVRRMHIISSNMLNEAVTALTHADVEEASSVIKADDDVDRFNFYSGRALNQLVENPTLLKDTGLKHRSEAIMAKTILKSIERVADHATSIAHLVSTSPSLQPRDAEGLRSQSAAVNRLYESAVSSFLKMDQAKAEETLEEHHAMKTKWEKLTPGPDARVGLAQEHIARVSDYAADICEAVIDMAVVRSMNVTPPKA